VSAIFATVSKTATVLSIFRLIERFELAKRAIFVSNFGFGNKKRGS